MKKQVFFIHGGDAYTKYEDYLVALKSLPLSLPGEVRSERWTQTLVEDLGPLYEVYLPSMPAKYNASYEEWVIWFERYFSYLKDGAILIGWSLGGLFLVKYLALNDLPFKPGKVFLLAAPFAGLNGEGNNDCGSFGFAPETLNALKNKDISIEIWHSKDDFVVPFSSALDYEKALPQAKTRFFDDKNHFLVASLPELLQAIRVEK